MRRPAHLRQYLLRASAAFLVALDISCAGIDHTIDDISVVHGLNVNHRFDVERYSWLSAQLKWGFGDVIPGLSSQAERSEQHLDDPAWFCYSRISEFLVYDLTSPYYSVEAAYWTGAIAEADPFPLSRIQALRVLSKISKQYSPNIDNMMVVDNDYQKVTLARLTRFARILPETPHESMTPDVKVEFLGIVKSLGETRYEKPRISREIARNLASAIAAVSDPDAKMALTKAIRLLVPRGALRQLVDSLNDRHEQVRISAAIELVACVGPQALPWILERQKDDTQAGVRASMVALVGASVHLDDPGAEKNLEFLAASTRDPESAVAVNAMEALGNITGIGREFDSDWWRRWWERRLLERKSPH